MSAHFDASVPHMSSQYRSLTQASAHLVAISLISSSSLSLLDSWTLLWTRDSFLECLPCSGLDSRYTLAAATAIAPAAMNSSLPHRPDSLCTYLHGSQRQPARAHRALYLRCVTSTYLIPHASIDLSDCDEPLYSCSSLSGILTRTSSPDHELWQRTNWMSTFLSGSFSSPLQLPLQSHLSQSN
jgi:hypothetical protein